MGGTASPAAASKPSWALVATVCLVPLAVGLPLLLGGHHIAQPDPYRAYDWIEAAKYRWYAVESLQAYGHLPRWNPFLEGGIPSWAHPSDGTTSPFLWTNVVFGVALGMKVDVVLLLLIGSLGTFALAWDWLGLRGAAAALPAVGVAVAGWAPSGVVVGFYESFYLLLVPPALWLVWRSTRAASAFGAAVWLSIAAVGVSFGAVQMQLCLPFAVLQCALWAAVAGGRSEGPTRAALVARVAAVFAAVGLLGMHKFLPMIEFVAARGWRIEEVVEPHFWGAGLLNLALGLFATASAVGDYLPGAIPLVSEYSYVGVPLSIAALAGVALVRERAALVGLGTLLIATVFLSYDPGPGFQPSLFALLRPLPIFSSIREPTRSVAFFVLLWMSLLGGVGLRALLAVPYEGTRRKALLLGIGAFLFVQAVWSAALFGQLLREDPPPLADAVGPEIASAGEWQQLQLTTHPVPGNARFNLLGWTAPPAGLGLVYRAEDLPPKGPTPVQGRWLVSPEGPPVRNRGYRGEAWLARGAGRVRSVQPGLDALEIDLVLAAPGEVQINQNFHAGWTGPPGSRVLDRGGLLAVELPEAVDGTVTLRFQPASVRTGRRVRLASLIGLLIGLAGLGLRSRAILRPDSVESAEGDAP